MPSFPVLREWRLFYCPCSALVSLKPNPFRPHRWNSERKISMKESFVPYFVPALAVACALTLTQTGRAQFASSVISYNAGSGTTAAYQDPTRSLGAPTTFIGYQDADPFNPAYSASHLVSVGAGGSLTLAFNQPIFNTSHAFGLDFNIFGNTGFIITNRTDENWN